LTHQPVIPAKAGIHDLTIHLHVSEEKSWMPACAGMTLKLPRVSSKAIRYHCWSYDHFRAHPIGDVARFMRFIMHRIQPVLVQCCALPLDLGMQHNSRHCLSSRGDLLHRPFGMVAIMQRGETRRPGSMQKTQA
jgi:hypothetical protein